MNIRNKLAAASAFTLGALSQAHAAVPADVTTALADLGTDAKTVAGVVLAAIVTVFAIKFIRRGL